MDTNICVCVRVRPLVARELAEGRRAVIHADEASITTSSTQLHESKIFSFNHCFGEKSTSEDISEKCMKRALDSLFEGYNSSVLAYGQTGSGKTHTTRQLTAELAQSLFQGVTDRSGQGVQCTVSASYIELYNEDVRDLLIPPPPAQTAEFILSSSQQAPFSSPFTPSISIREHPNGEIFLEGASEVVVESEEQLLLLIRVGEAARATGATALNEHSSRSHSALIINLTQQLPPDPGTGELVIVSGKFHIVDLAGSERTKKSKSEGSRLKEAVNINAGLLALGNVISALSENKAYIPYRDSKLTRLLQDSIGGNSITTLIACVSPADDSLEESLNTLKYANRAKNIKNQPKQNSVSSGMSDEQRALALLKQIVQNIPVSQGLSMTLRELLEASKWSHEACVAVIQRLRQALKINHQAPYVHQAEAAALEVLRLTEEVARLRADKDGLEARSCSIQQAVRNGLTVISQLAADGQISPVAEQSFLSAIGSTASASCYLLPAHASQQLGGMVSPARISSYPLDFSPGSNGSNARAAQEESAVVAASSSLAQRGLDDEAAALRVRVAELEAELTTCSAELRQAKEDLDKDEVIFAAKMAEMDEMRKLIESQAVEREAELPEEAESGSSWQPNHKPRYTDGSRSAPDGGDDMVLYDEETEEGDEAGMEHDEGATAEAAGRLVGALEAEASADRDQALLEQEVAKERESHEVEKAAMQDKIGSLEAEIRDREGVIEQLQGSESEARSARDRYKLQLQEAQQELDLKVAEIEELQADLHALLSDKVRSTEEKASLVAQCEERIAEANTRLSSLRKKLKEQEAMLRASIESEGLGPAASRVERLRAELAKMKAQQDSLKKELMAKDSAGEKQAQARSRELIALKKAAEEAKKHVKKLEEETRSQRETIRRKDAELEADKRRIKELLSVSNKSASSTPSKASSVIGVVKRDQGSLPRGLGLPPKPPAPLAWGASPQAVAAAAKASAFNNSARARAMMYSFSTGKPKSGSGGGGGLTRARLNHISGQSSLPPSSVPKHQPRGPSSSSGTKEMCGITASAVIDVLVHASRERKRAETELEDANQSLEALLTQSIRVDGEKARLAHRMKGSGFDDKEMALLDRLESLSQQLRLKIGEFEALAELKRLARSRASEIEMDLRRQLEEKPLSHKEVTEALMKVVDAVGSSSAGAAHQQRISSSSSHSTPTHSAQAPPAPINEPIQNVNEHFPSSKLGLVSHSLHLNSSVDIGSSIHLPSQQSSQIFQSPATVSKVLDFGAISSVNTAMDQADEALLRSSRHSDSYPYRATGSRREVLEENN